MSSLLIKNVVLNQHSVDILIKENRFAQIASAINEKSDEIIYGHGKMAILPAFYNAHNHAAMTLLRSYADDLPLQEWLTKFIWPVEAKMTPEDIEIGSRLACIEMIRSGTVFFNDMYWRYERVVKAADEMGMRFGSGPLILNAFNPQIAESQDSDLNKFLETLESFPSRMIPMLNPHAIYSVKRETLEKLGELAARHKLPVHIHLSETRQELKDCIREHGVRPAFYLDSLGLLTKKTILAHAIWIDDAERELLHSRGVSLAHMPISNMKLSNGVFNVAAAQLSGIRVVLGTDGCSSNNSLDMLQEMKFAALLAKHFSGVPTTLPAAEAYKMATRYSAEAFGLDAGVIETGKLADAILVDLEDCRLTPGHNLISDMVYSADSSVIDTVICDGRILMKNRQIPGEKEIIEMAREAAKRLTK
ncbi:MAG TPA: amidohydrolase [Candidatus Marinimicrobia bacterium]|nr:amidohydrolase [Candidatus Neomarinimicrobiota bacterium]